MKKIVILYMAILFLFVPFGEAWAKENTLIILPFSGGDKMKEYQTLQDGLPDMLTACLSPYSENISILERSDLNMVMKELGIRYDFEMDEKTLPKLSKIKQAKFLLKGSFFVVGDNLTVQANLYDIESSILLSSTDSNTSIDKIGELCIDMAKKIVLGITNKLDLSGLKIDKTPVITEHFLKGLGYYYAGACHKAIPEFLKVLKSNSKHYDARYWLARCYQNTGLDGSAVLEFQELSNQIENIRYQDVKQRLEKLRE